MAEKIKLILTGGTGMVGEGVLFECLENEKVADVLSVSRKPCGTQHPKLKELIIKDFFDLGGVENQLSGYDACLFCLGISSLGISADDYYKTTYTLTMHFAETLAKQNKDMVFCYISGANTDSTEKGRSRWARVKGKTENDLMKLSFKKVYNFRPGILKPTQGQQHVLSAYKYFGWIYPIVRALGPYGTTIQELGKAMINASADGFDKNHVEVKDILALSKS